MVFGLEGVKIKTLRAFNGFNKEYNIFWNTLVL